MVKIGTIIGPKYTADFSPPTPSPSQSISRADSRRGSSVNLECEEIDLGDLSYDSLSRSIQVSFKVGLLMKRSKHLHGHAATLVASAQTEAEIATISREIRSWGRPTIWGHRRRFYSMKIFDQLFGSWRAFKDHRLNTKKVSLPSHPVVDKCLRSKARAFTYFGLF